MKILYVDVFLHAINPSNTLMSQVISGAGDVTFYGPGYCSEEQVSGGIARFAERTGPYDIVMLGTNVPVIIQSEEDLRASVRYVEKFTALASTGELIYSFFKDVLANFRSVPAMHYFAALISFDAYSTTQQHVDRLEEFGLKLITPNAHFVRQMKDLPAWTQQEKHYQRQSTIFSDAWFSYLQNNPEKVVTAFHFVGDAEFSFRGLSERKRQVSIPGVDYVTRREAMAALKKAGMRVNGKGIYNVFRTLNRAGINVYANYGLLKFFNGSYLYDLLDTKYVYTAAEAFGVPIRKYFEIPASGAVLLSSACCGFERIGFKDRENCVLVEPQNLADIVKYLEKNPDEAQHIATAGRKLMFEQHSVAARAAQIKTCLEALMAGSYAGSEWIDGEFQIHRKEAVSANVARVL